MYSPTEMKQHAIQEAKREITKIEAMKILLGNNDFAAEIHVAGIVVGTSVNERILPVLDAELLEIKKFLNGEENNWE